ncbi:MAG: OmpA family protein, partial [Candidatus Methylomirabilis sp.]|nr:OmpA family protein [Deltaproteobacteria bacterium]
APPPPPSECDAASLAQFKLADGLFAFDRYDLSAELQARLGTLVDLLKKCPGTRVQIAGHTDWTGPDQYNMTLSRKRANSVRLFLIEQGIAEERLIAVGFGEAKPVAPNATKEGRAKNRRTEFTVLPPEATE